MDPKNRLNDDETRVNAMIGRVRARGPRLRDDHVTLAHGAGGKASAALVGHVFLEEFGATGESPANEALAAVSDAAVVTQEGLADGWRLALSTDSYVVNPIEFPGGDIGELAVNGTVNDLSMAGAEPRHLTAAFILEEGLDVEVLRRIARSMRRAADAAGVTLAAGDTKVVPRGAADRLYITTAGVGAVPPGRDVGDHRVREGDRILLSGPIADHGMAVMMARGDLAIDAPIASDTRALNGDVRALFDAGADVRWLRDATRGGLATVLNELAHGTGLGVVLEEEAVPVRDMTRACCDMLGIDPLYVANEGTFTAVVAAADADAAVAALRAAGAPEARVVGRIVAEPAASVVLVTGFGGTRMVDMLVGDPLPRIC
ncbi:hydrogenase expression/formation protein HypE [Corynebacterium sp.]|uniref:hydrogenase expression/formation protein HypE n=1 Tax=Corynebacterium sp. TaxID=1720 RepID=UPI0026DC80C4|nr:hydrogenase expression/formation protein HypE [Corynebacterium sp.]MDO4609799.1 hydrogenase expression/formation protein HypE [Corynebacterium sp.]